MELSRYSLDLVREDAEFILYRAHSKQVEPPSMLLLTPSSTRPSPETLEKINHEYSLSSELDNIWALPPLAISSYNDKRVLVLEDPGGAPLNRVVQGPMEMKLFLRLAIQISNAVGQLHRRRLIHKDLKPSNIFVARESGRVWLTGFGIASRLARERQPPEPPEFIAGTLPYMAPEQTGRMNRSIDSRSDLYALGVTLYEMLTGSLPFTASDPMEWVHCHIARQPIPPAERLPNIPGPVSAIVMKLLAKTAEERYQTALGLERDLQRCLNEWETYQHVDEFPLGEHDTPDRLLIPEKLYGRETEIETLLTSFDCIVAGDRPELVLVSGYSGVGKSSVVNELHKSLVPPRGLFASGKFDQYKRDIPYATLAQAFQSLVRPLLSKTEAELRVWREALLEALGPNGRLMVDLVSELKLIIGEPPPVPELPPQDAQRRFQLVFRRFIGVFARPEHPLALFLDDLQWLDAATLDLLEDMLIQSDLQHLMLIGAYRDNEVTAIHPLMRKLEIIKNAGGKLAEIALAPLSREHLGQLIADALRCELERAAPLAQLVHEKTGGNPFFAIQFISSLADERMLAFDHATGRWSWDLDHIHARGYTDNVVDLMVGKLTRLPAETQNALRQLACLGNCAEVTIFAIILGVSEEHVHTALYPAVRQELVERLVGTYRFVHDRVQEGAYSLIPQEVRAQAHLRIGRLLVAHVVPAKREEVIFDIVNQLNRGADLIISGEERDQVAELNLHAGKRAKGSTAYASALNYLVAGAALVPRDSWARRHDLIFELELNRAECEFLTGALAEAEGRLTALSPHAANVVERATVACLQVDVCTALDQSGRAVAAALDYLRYVGIDWSQHPTEEEARYEYDQILSHLGSRAIEDAIDLPLMSDPESLATLDVLMKLVPAAVFTDRNLLCLTVCRMVNLSLERGNCDASCMGYVTLGKIAGRHFGDYQAGFRFGGLGHELVERRGLKRFDARVYLCFQVFVVNWMKHVRTCRELVQRAFEAANKNGDLTFATYCNTNLVANLLFAGDPLPEVQCEAEHGLAFAENARFGLAIDFNTPQLALILTLRGLTPKFGSFDGGGTEELRFEHHLAGNSALAIAECWYWIRKLQARYLAGDYAAALEASSRAERLLWTSSAFLEEAEYHFYSALSRAACCDSVSADGRQQSLNALADHQRQLDIWAANCPENFENRAALVGAEIARIEGRTLDAERLYEQAIRSAHSNGFVHSEAIAYEVAARFYAARGFQKFADAYLLEARYCYERWGADGKLAQLDHLYPHLKKEGLISTPTSTILAPTEILDLATVIKVSQTVSTETDLDKLIDTVMGAAVEHAGATRGLLFLSREDGQRIEAEATTIGAEIMLQREEAALGSAPQSIVNYVVRTHEFVILDDASSQNRFATDTYFSQQHARSVLCLPLTTQGKLVGLLYLENSLTPNVFTPKRIAVLKLLVSQAAISLENAHLYADLRQREAKIRRLVEANVVGIVMWDLEGAITEANEAFLRMVQYDRDDLVSGRLRWTDLTPADCRDRDERAIAELKTNGVFQPYEKEYFRKDSSRVPILLGGALFEDSGNEGVALILDLSEQKRTEEALRRNESYLAQAQRLAHIGSWAWDATGRNAVYVSEEWCRIYGFDPKDGMPSWEQRLQRVHPEDRARFQLTIDQTVAEKSDYDVEFRILPLHAPSRYIHSVGRPILGSSGELVQFVGVSMDVTESKRAEQEHERLRQELANLAHLNRVSTVGELTASLAHEIKQPIGAAVTNADACVRLLDRDQPDVPEAREAALEMAKNARRAAEIVDRVRSLYQKGSSQRETIDVNEVIGQMVVMLQNEANRHSVAIRTDLAEVLPMVMADRVQLQQVLLNLMVNGIEAIRDTSGELSIKSVVQDDGQLLISVTDTGVGLPTENAEQIFNPFFTTKSQGTGLGLAITRSIVESHGGRIWAAGNSGRGATFSFTLPNRVAVAA